jgi:hypothetical protein
MFHITDFRIDNDTKGRTLYKNNEVGKFACQPFSATCCVDRLSAGYPDSYSRAIVRRIVVRGHLFAVPFVRLTVVRTGSYATNK